MIGGTPGSVCPYCIQVIVAVDPLVYCVNLMPLCGYGVHERCLIGPARMWERMPCPRCNRETLLSDGRVWPAPGYAASKEISR